MKSLGGNGAMLVAAHFAALGRDFTRSRALPRECCARCGQAGLVPQQEWLSCLACGAESPADVNYLDYITDHERLAPLTRYGRRRAALPVTQAQRLAHEEARWRMRYDYTPSGKVARLESLRRAHPEAYEPERPELGHPDMAAALRRIPAVRVATFVALRSRHPAIPDSNDQAEQERWLLAYGLPRA